MTARRFVLNTAAGGIDRREIISAPQSVLYDLVNGYVDGRGKPRSRAGTALEVLFSAGLTKGLMAWANKLWVFSHASVTSDNPKYDVLRINDPEQPSATLVNIHFAAPYLGYPYVVAEFSSGRVWHFWIVAPEVWTPDTAMSVGDIVAPTVPNGFYYRAGRQGNPSPVWAPDVPRAINDIVEPTEANGFRYTVVAVEGDNPRSGSEEPDWPEEDGAQVTEDVDQGAPAGTPGTGGTDTTPGGPGTVPSPIEDRYGSFNSRNSPGSEAEQ